MANDNHDELLPPHPTSKAGTQTLQGDPVPPPPTASAPTASEENADLSDNIDIDAALKVLKQGKEDPKQLPKNIRSIAERERAESKRVEDSIEGTHTNPRWFVWLFSALLVIGVIWVIVAYLTSMFYPIPHIGMWNIVVGFCIIVLGFILTLAWH